MLVISVLVVILSAGRSSPEGTLDEGLGKGRVSEQKRRPRLQFYRKNMAEVSCHHWQVPIPKSLTKSRVGLKRLSMLVCRASMDGLVLPTTTKVGWSMTSCDRSGGEMINPDG